LIVTICHDFRIAGIMIGTGEMITVIVLPLQYQ
jgi:hypothetical protein